VSVERLTIEEIDEAYRAGTDRFTGEPADCASCARRHPKRALAWWPTLPPGEPDRYWIVAAICDACAELDRKTMIHGVDRHWPPVRRVIATWDGGTFNLYVANPDFAVERRS
jgi:hypothetical protein